MSKVTIEWNDAGFQELLKSSEMQSMLGDIASQKASAAGEGYGSEVHVFQKRAAAHVFPVTTEASRDNYYHNTLLKVVGV